MENETTTTVTLHMGAEDVLASSLAVLEHLLLYPPHYASIEYNNGVAILIRSIREALHIDEPATYENQNL